MPPKPQKPSQKGRSSCSDADRTTTNMRSDTPAKTNSPSSVITYSGTPTKVNLPSSPAGGDEGVITHHSTPTKLLNSASSQSADRGVITHHSTPSKVHGKNSTSINKTQAAGFDNVGGVMPQTSSIEQAQQLVFRQTGTMSKTAPVERLNLNENNKCALRLGDFHCCAIIVTGVVKVIKQPLMKRIQQAFVQSGKLDDDKYTRIDNSTLLVAGDASDHPKFSTKVQFHRAHPGTSKPNSEFEAFWEQEVGTGSQFKYWVKIGSFTPLAGKMAPFALEKADEDVLSAEKEALDGLKHNHTATDHAARYQEITVIVGLKPLVSVIGDLSTMTCWSAPGEKSRIEQLGNKLATAAIVPKREDRSLHPDVIVHGNRVFTHPELLSNGLERRQGVSTKIFLGREQAEVDGTKSCERHFFQPIQVSEFIRAFFGRTAFSAEESDVIERMSKVLMGKRVYVADPARKGHSVIRQIVAGPAQRYEVPKSGSPFETVSLTERFESLGTPLRYTDMPCIDIGLSDRPFYVPAEVCKLERGQAFRGAVPLSVDHGAFTSRGEKHSGQTKKPDSHPSTRPSIDDAKSLDLVFAEIIVLPEDAPDDQVDAYRHVPCDTWKHFQGEIGQRFEQSMKAAVDRSRKLSLVFRGGRKDNVAGWADKLREHVSILRGSECALIVSVPQGQHNVNIHRSLRYLCDVILGIQCAIVRTKTLVTNMQLVPYADSVVRKIFHRAMKVHCPQWDETALFEERYGKASAPEKSLLVGIHVVPVKEIVDPSQLRNSIANAADKVYLVTVASYANAVYRPGKEFRSTNHLVSTVHGNLLGIGVKESVLAHLKDRRAYEVPSPKPKIPTRIVYYRSGHAADDRMMMSEEVHCLSLLPSSAGLGFDSKGSASDSVETAHLTYVEQPSLSMGDEKTRSIPRNAINCIVRRLDDTKLVSKPHALEVFHSEPSVVLSDAEHDIEDNDLCHPMGIDRALTRHFMRSKQEIDEACRTYLVTHCKRSSYPLTDSKLYKHHVQSYDNNAVAAFNFKLDEDTKADLEKGCVAHLFHSVLKSTAMPDMMYLTQKASARVRNYIEEVPLDQCNTDVAGNMTQFRLNQVHENLVHSLYFL